MTGSERGRFCLSCKKEVLDLTGKTDDVILKILEDKNFKVCGRIESRKLSKQLSLNTQTRLSFLSKAASVALAIFGLITGTRNEALSQTLQGQHEPKPDKLINDSTNVSRKEWRIRGTVRDKKTTEGIFAANVVVYRGDSLIAGAVTDFDGNFSITLKESQIDTLEKYNVRITFIGYSDVRIADLPLNSENYLVDLRLVNLESTETETIMVGLIIKEPVKKYPSRNTYKSRDIRRMPY